MQPITGATDNSPTRMHTITCRSEALAVLSCLHSLEELNLSFNKIETLDALYEGTPCRPCACSESFASTPPKRFLLLCSHCSQTSRTLGGERQGLQSLQQLDLRENRISETKQLSFLSCWCVSHHALVASHHINEHTHTCACSTHIVVHYYCA